MGFNSTLKFSNLHHIPRISMFPCTIPWFREAADSARLVGRDQNLSASRTKEESTNLSVIHNLE